MTALGGVIFCSHNILVLTTPCPPLPPALDVSVPFLSLPSSPVHIPPHLNYNEFHIGTVE